MSDFGFDILLAIGEIDEEMLNEAPKAAPKLFTGRQLAFAASFILVIGVILIFAINVMLGGATAAPGADYDGVADDYENMTDSNASQDGSDVSGTSGIYYYAVLYTEEFTDNTELEGDSAYGTAVILTSGQKTIRIGLTDGKIRIILKTDTHPTYEGSTILTSFSGGYAEFEIDAAKCSCRINNILIQVEPTSENGIYEVKLSVTE